MCAIMLIFVYFHGEIINKHVGMSLICIKCGIPSKSIKNPGTRNYFAGNKSMAKYVPPRNNDNNVENYFKTNFDIKRSKIYSDNDCCWHADYLFSEGYHFTSSNYRPGTIFFERKKNKFSDENPFWRLYIYGFPVDEFLFNFSFGFYDFHARFITTGRFSHWIKHA